VPPWEFEKDGEVITIEPSGPLVVSMGGGTDLAVDAAIAGVGIVFHFEDWISPLFRSGALLPILKDWWQAFDGPYLYYPGRRLVPGPLRAFVDFVKGAAR
jgi:DNA-binding transcriptional LysR family regulator